MSNSNFDKVCAMLAVGATVRMDKVIRDGKEVRTSWDGKDFLVTSRHDGYVKVLNTTPKTAGDYEPAVLNLNNEDVTYQLIDGGFVQVAHSIAPDGSKVRHEMTYLVTPAPAGKAEPEPEPEPKPEPEPEPEPKQKPAARPTPKKSRK